MCSKVGAKLARKGFNVTLQAIETGTFTFMWA